MFLFRKLWNKMVSGGNACPAEEQKDGEAPACGMYFSGSAVSDVGCVRENNEDNYLLELHMNEASNDHSAFSVSMCDRWKYWHLAGVFDGMGGGELGELASQKTAQIIRNGISGLSRDSGKADVDGILKGVFLEANNEIVALRQKCSILGTTGTVVCTNNREFKLYHLGDSRAYLFREGKLYQLTKDQTLAQMKIDAGLYREDAPEAEADKHKLTEFIGRDQTRKSLHPVESEWIPLQKEDCLLLCSDGLYDMCSDKEIEELLGKHHSARAQCEGLIEAARQNGGADNITCVILAFS